MKFPLASRPFEGVSVSHERAAALETLADDVLQATIKEYHEFVYNKHRQLSRDQWKSIKTMENVTVYKERTATSNRVLGPLDIHAKQGACSSTVLPKMLAVGIVRGSVYDLMLGNTIPDAAAVLAKSASLSDEFVDSHIIQNLRGDKDKADAEDPFRFVTLNWCAKTQPAGLNVVMAPRDLVHIQSTGVLREEKIGYVVVHSVDLPECTSLERTHGILRSKKSIVALFHEATPTTVEVFITAYIDPNGSAHENIGLARGMNHMRSMWRVDPYVHNVKLAWALQHKNVLSSRSMPFMNGGSCSMCSRVPGRSMTGKKRPLEQCGLCDALVCRRCRLKKVLPHVDERMRGWTTKHMVCSPCLMGVVNDDAKRVMRGTRDSPSGDWNADRTTENRSRTEALSESSSDESTQRWSETSGLEDHNSGIIRVNLVDPAATPLRDKQRSLSMLNTPRQVALPPSTPPTPSSHMTDLYSKMVTLNIAAQRTYEITLDTANRHLQTDKAA